MGQAGRGDERHIAARRPGTARTAHSSRRRDRLRAAPPRRAGRRRPDRSSAHPFVRLRESSPNMPAFFPSIWTSAACPFRNRASSAGTKPVPLDVHELENGFERALEVVEIIQELLFVRIALRMLQPGQRHAELKPLFREQFRIPAERLADFEQLLGQVSPRDVPARACRAFRRAGSGAMMASSRLIGFERRIRSASPNRLSESADSRFTVL